MLKLWLRLWCERRLGQAISQRYGDCCRPMESIWLPILQARRISALKDMRRSWNDCRDKYAVLLLATVDGAAAGCVALRRIPTDGLACEMKRLWVDGTFRGLGLGRRLVEDAIDWAKRQGFETMYLDTVPAAMPEANRLYAAMGFERVERYNENPLPGVEFFRLGLDGRVT